MPAHDDPSERLDSWKEIAAYLDRQVRSVQRWEKYEGLPVHRVAHRSQGSVYALKSELDAWRERRHPQPVPPPAEPEPIAVALSPPSFPPASPRRRRAVALTAGGMAALIVAGWMAWRPPPTPILPHWRPPGRLFARGTSEGASPRLLRVGLAPYAAAISADGASLYVANTGDGTLSVIATGAERVQSTLRLGGVPSSIAVAPDGRRIYVGNLTGDRVDVIDLKERRDNPAPAGGRVNDLALTPDGRQLYLAMLYSGLARLDTATLSLSRLISPACPAYLALAPNPARLFVAYQCGGLGGRDGHDAVGVLDLASGRFSSSIVGPPQVGGAIAVSRDGAEIWTSRGDACSAAQYDHQGCGPEPSGGANIFNVGERTYTRTVALPSSQGAGRISFFPGDDRAVVGGTQIAVVDTTRLAVLESLPADTYGDVVLSGDGRHAYLPLTRANMVAVFDASPSGCAPPSPGLLGWWPGDGSAADAWGMSQGHFQGAAGGGFAPGRVGQAFSLPGHNGWISFGHDANLILSRQGFAVAAWVKLPPPRAPMPILGKMSARGANREGWQLLRRSDGRLTLCFGGGDRDGCAAGGPTTLTMPAPLPPERWHHVAAVVYPRGDGLLFLDGRVVARGRLDSSHSQSAGADLLLGADAAHTAFLRGLVDEVVLYDAPPPPNAIQGFVQGLVQMPACLGISPLPR